MAINYDSIRRATTLITPADGVLVRVGEFVDLGLHLRVPPASPRPDAEEKRIQEMHGSYSHLMQDLWNIETAFERLDLQHRLWVAGELNSGVWFRFASLDIDIIHVETRSLFDYAAQILQRVAAKPGTVPKSFNDLLAFAEKSDGHKQRLGEPLVELLRQCHWFSDYRLVRDNVVHRGAQTLVFLEKPHFWFQTFTDFRNKINIPEIMPNENIIDFPLYAGVLYGYILDFLERMSVLLNSQVALNRVGGRSRSSHPGIAVGREWMDRVLRIPDEGQAGTS
jgi:hypothetical protein